MKRAHRTVHPAIWTVVAVAAAAAVSFGLRVRPHDVPPSLPQAAAAEFRAAD